MSKYVFMSSIPTPNGKLHLGHIGSQYLKLDVLKRHYNRLGHQAVTVNGTDTFDNSVMFSAQQRSQSVADTVNYYCSSIQSSLRYLNMEQDIFANYIEKDWNLRFRNSLTEVDALLAEYKVEVEELFPYEKESGLPVSGRWLRGECCHCSAPVCGYTCDYCSRELAPTDIVDPVTPDNSPIVWRTVKNTHLRINATQLREYTNQLNFHNKYRYLVEEKIKDNHILIPWTTYDRWGIETGKYPYQVYLYRHSTFIDQVTIGEVVRDLLDLKVNAYDADSECEVVLAFGKDNAGAVVSDLSAIALATNKFKANDHILISDFVTLESQKISTSRPHAIWVEDLYSMDEISSDSVRAYLCHKHRVDEDFDISTTELHSFSAKIRHNIEAKVAHHIEIVDVNEPSSIQATNHQRILSYLSQQSSLLDHSCPKLSGAYEVIEEWINDEQSCGERLSSKDWLITFVLLASPILPSLCAKISDKLKLHTPFTVSDFRALTDA